MLETNRSRALSATTAAATVDEFSALTNTDSVAGAVADTDIVADTALEQQSRGNASFANYTTGTLALDITPEMETALAPLRQLQLGTNYKRLATFIQTLQREFPLHNGTLTAIINPAELATEVPHYETPEDMRSEVIERATWPFELANEQALLNGVPVWDRLPGERADFYLVFKIYRDGRYGMLDNGDYLLQNRSLAGVAHKLIIPAAILSTISKIYNWPTRCAYYDRFFELEIARRRQMNVRMLESDQLKNSTRLINKSMEYLDKNVNNMKPSEVISLLELGMKYSRISLGLLPDKPGDAGGQSPTVAVNFNQTKQDSKVYNDHRTFVGPAAEQLSNSMKQDDTLLTILDVLQRSGAMNTALNQQLATVVEADIITEESSDE